MFRNVYYEESQRPQVFLVLGGQKRILHFIKKKNPRPTEIHATATLFPGLWLGLSAVGVFDLLVVAILRLQKLIQRSKEEPKLAVKPYAEKNLFVKTRFHFNND